MKKKRGRGEGSIFRRKDGRWSSVLSIGSGNDVQAQTKDLLSSDRGRRSGPDHQGKK